jgi:hypothetical protein
MRGNRPFPLRTGFQTFAVPSLPTYLHVGYEGVPVHLMFPTPCGATGVRSSDIFSRGDLSPCLRSVPWGWTRWGAMSKPTPLCELLRSTRISRQEVPRLPTGEGYSGTWGQVRPFLYGCPKEVSRTPTHDWDSVFRNSCPPPAWYGRRNTDNGFSEPRRHVGGTPKDRAQSIGCLPQTGDLPTSTVSSVKLRGCLYPPLISDNPARAQSPLPQNHAFHGLVQAHGKSCVTRSLCPASVSLLPLCPIRRPTEPPHREPNIEDDWSDHLSRRRSVVASPSSSTTDLLQWNLNSFRSRHPDLQALLHGRNPAIVCLQ